ncbi:hypothetical protein SAMN06265348_102489 [Pedobacter westerhofensis]|uniref:Amidohydrolase-related domain-containing protein n=1 Tax=Pedobacter westerhofensis TaxID=425512 RepID=A0A521BQE3_9SPHI|nr:amidohydrolase family protein [Pedobacter westerhofensis]SMO48971.1 hypothetical protein SAMN06265348_102489 [Pedobacter westerhofensis]
MRKALWLFLPLLQFSAGVSAQQRPLPVIDMHLHALSVTELGPPPLKLGAPFKYWGGNDPQHDFGEVYQRVQKTAEWNDKSVTSALTDHELEASTLHILRKRNIYGVLSGSINRVRKWKAAEPKHIINAVYWDFSHIQSEKLDADSLRRLFKSGEFKVFSEIAIQYEGITPSDSVFEPYLQMAEDLDIPIGIHIGPGPPGAPFQGAVKYRARMHSALVLEQAMIRHPKLRVYAMHAGWPMIDDMIAMLYTYPQLYVDLGVIDYILPKKEFYGYLKRLVDAGFGKRIMYGSDQMVWPKAMEISIDNIQHAPFLTAAQKRDIFFNNAARFLRLSRKQIREMR